MATKTINLTGAEVAVTGLDGAHAHIRNDGTEVIYAAKTAGITAGADGVASIPAGQSDTIRGISGTVYLLGTGSVLIQSDDYVTSPFKTSAASGGSAVDEVARTAINTHAGNDEIHVTAEEKASWNGKAELSDIPTTLPANGGNADTANGLVYHELGLDYTMTASDFSKPGIYGITSLASGSPNVLDEDGFNVGDFKVLALNNNPNFQMVIMTSPRYTDNRAYIGRFWDNNFIGWKRISDGGNATNSTHQTENFLPNGTDILAYVNGGTCPSNTNTIVKIFNSPTCPTNYGYDGADNDFVYEIYKLNNNWVTVKAYDIRSNSEFINSCRDGGWIGWVRCNDGGNAATLETHPASDFVLKSDYDALAARVAALEGGTT